MLLGGKVDLTAVTVVVSWVVAVVGVEVLLLSKDDITSGADEAGGGVYPVEVALAILHFW